MDIIVHQPNKFLLSANVFKGQRILLWPISRKPDKLKIGDKVYVAVDEKILHYYTFKGFVQDPKCELSGKIIPGLCLLLSISPISLDKEIVAKKSRGFKYYESR